MLYPFIVNGHQTPLCFFRDAMNSRNCKIFWNTMKGISQNSYCKALQIYLYPQQKTYINISDNYAKIE